MYQDLERLAEVPVARHRSESAPSPKKKKRNQKAKAALGGRSAADRNRDGHRIYS
jgi:hypothetical protein